MLDPFLGELQCVAFNFPPKGWALCNGQLLPINQNQALFSLLGTTYGGNGQTNFALPDLRGRAPNGLGAGFTQGERAGGESVTLLSSQMPAHIHAMRGDAVTAATSNTNLAAANSSLGNSIGVPSSGGTFSESVYDTAVPGATLDPLTISNTGGNQPHSNLQPFLTLNWIIALVGIFPSQN